MLLAPYGDYAQLRERFAWSIPARYNIGVGYLRPLGGAGTRPPGHHRRRAGGAPDDDLCCVAGHFEPACAPRWPALASRRGDRVAVFLPQMAEAIAAQVAIYKLGADRASPGGGVRHRRPELPPERRGRPGGDHGRAREPRSCRRSSPKPPCLEEIISVDGPDGSVLGFDDLIGRAGAAFEPVATGKDDPALMIYTSGTTGLPKGALHAHRVLPGHLPGVRFSHDFLPQPGDLMWTPADWAWAGGLLNAVLPCLHFGVPVVAQRRDHFDPDAVLALLRDLQIRNAFIPPTALRMLRAHHGAPVSGPGPAEPFVGRRGAGNRNPGLGPAGARGRAQRRLWPDRMQLRARVRARRSGSASRARSAAPCRAIRSR